MRSGQSQAGPGPKAVPGDLDPRSVFMKKSQECLDDKRIARFFEPNLVRREDVIDALNGEAFDRAIEKVSYDRYAKVHEKLCEVVSYLARSESGDTSNSETFVITGGSVLAGILALIGFLYFNTPASDIALPSAMSAALLPPLLARRRTFWRRPSFLSLHAAFLLSAIILPYVLIGFSWTVFLVAATGITMSVVVYLLSGKHIGHEFSRLPTFWKNNLIFTRRKARVMRLQKEWVDDCVDDIIMPNAVKAAKEILGKDQERLLIVENSEGLRKLQDASFFVPTSSERELISKLARMDGGSIVLLGPRGAGKTTLLKKLVDPALPAETHGISVYMNAPAEYVPREFIAEFLQQLCEAYLEYAKYPLPKSLHTERQKLTLQHVLNSAPALSRLVLRAAASIALIFWILKPYFGSDPRHIYLTAIPGLQHWYGDVTHHIYEFLFKVLGRYWTAARVVVVVLAMAIFPTPRRWWKHLRLPKTPPLAAKAYGYLRRLRVDQRSTEEKNVSLPFVRSLAMSWRKGSTVGHQPWSANELASQIRLFMQEITDSFSNPKQKIMIAIDEVDRIGSLEYAKKFIDEIKPIFGVSNCFFLVAATEDIGSAFTQRPGERPSILGNVFNDKCNVIPLNFKEARDLLRMRVPEFTDSYTFLVLALSGGLPRELIQAACRLVDLKQELNSNSSRYPSREDLTFMLIKQELCERIQETRRRLSHLRLHGSWSDFDNRLYSANGRLQRISFPATPEQYNLISELSELAVPGPVSPANIDSGYFPVPEDEGIARQLADLFITFSYFGITVIDAFRDSFFDLDLVQQTAESGLGCSYQELAAARVELSVSPDVSRSILEHFRSFLPAPDP